MALFGEKKDAMAGNDAKRAAAAEFSRLIAMSPADLAAQLMPAFGSGGAVPSVTPKAGGRPLTCDELAHWLLREVPQASRTLPPNLDEAIREAVQVLEHAELIYMRSQGESISNQRWNATRLGRAALANGDYRQRITDR